MKCVVACIAELQMKRQNSFLEEVNHGTRTVHRQGCFEKVKPNPISTEKKYTSVNPSGISISKNSFLQMTAVKMKYEAIILKMKHKC